MQVGEGSTLRLGRMFCGEQRSRGPSAAGGESLVRQGGLGYVRFVRSYTCLPSFLTDSMSKLAPRDPSCSRHLWVLLVGLFWIALPADGVAQAPSPPGSLSHEVFAGSEFERFLRTLQNVGAVGVYPWSIRGIAPSEAEALVGGRALGPWGSRYSVPARPGGFEVGLTQPSVHTAYNSAFPFGGNDGPVWTGRGLTSELRFGTYLRWGPLSAVVHPVLFRAENRAFEMAETGLEGDGRYRTALTPGSMDLPQRFGADAYARMDPGYSTVRLEGGGVTLGVSTAGQHWGPAHLHPLVLGPAAGGFPHVFLGTDRPRDIWIGRLHARHLVGQTVQSPYFGRTGADRKAMFTGLVVAFEPRWIQGLELGAMRTFKLHWVSTESRIEQLMRPFETFIKSNIDDPDARRDQQFASVFARWNFPDVGVEFFGEYVRVDHSYDLRVLIAEPDDQAGYALGLRRVWAAEDGTLTVFRAEAMTSGSTHRERAGARTESAYSARPIYHEGSAPGLGGHTHRGQLLATVAGEFGHGQTLGLDRYDEGGWWSLELDRRLVRDNSIGAIPEGAAASDVQLAVGAKAGRFRGRWEFRAGLTGVAELSRHLRDDAFNLRLDLGARLVSP